MSRTLILSLGLLFAAMAHADRTELDPAFQGDGRADFSDANRQMNALAHLPRSDGGSIAVINSHGNTAGNQSTDDLIFLAKYSAAGVHEGGPFVIGAAFSKVGAAAIDSQNRVIIVGTINNASASNIADFRVIRVLPNGQRDNSFSGDGIIDIDFALGGNNADHALGVTVDSQDRVIVVGEVERVTTGDFDFGVARVTTEGVLDVGFHMDGKRAIPFDLPGGVQFDTARAVVISAEGRMTIGGTARHAALGGGFGVTRIALARLLDNGNFDISFCNVSCNYMSTYTGIHSGRRVIFYGNDTPPQSDTLAAMSINNANELLTAGTTPGSGETLGYVQKFAADGNWSNETTTQGGASGNTQIGGVHWTTPNLPGGGNVVLTGTSAVDNVLFFAQRFDSVLSPAPNWGDLGPASSVYVWSASGAFGDHAGNRAGLSAIDTQGRVLAGGRYRKNSAADDFSASIARLTYHGPNLFKNGFE